MAIQASVIHCPSPNGGDEEDRTPDPLLARQVLSQLSYTPVLQGLGLFLLITTFEGTRKALPTAPAVSEAFFAFFLSRKKEGCAFQIKQRFAERTRLTIGYETFFKSQVSLERR